MSTYLAKMLIGPQDHFHCGNPSEIAWSYSPAVERVTLVLEGIGDGKVRVNSSSLDHPLVIPPDQALEIVAIEKITIRPRSCVSLLAQP